MKEELLADLDEISSFVYQLRQSVNALDLSEPEDVGDLQEQVTSLRREFNNANRKGQGHANISEQLRIEQSSRMKAANKLNVNHARARFVAGNVKAYLAGLQGDVGKLKARE